MAQPWIGEKGEGGEGPENADQAGGDGGDRGRFGDQEPGPGVEEPGERTIGVAHVDVLSARLWLHGAEFGIGEGAEEREQAAHDPCQVDKPGRTNGLHHFFGDKEDAAANDGADYYRTGVRESEITGEFGAFAIAGLGSHHDRYPPWRMILTQWFTGPETSSARTADSRVPLGAGKELYHGGHRGHRGKSRTGNSSSVFPVPSVVQALDFAGMTKLAA